MSGIFLGKQKALEFIKKNCPSTSVIYDKNDILILMVESFHDCNALFNDCTISWCIARNEDHWNDYVRSPRNKQYFIIDFKHINDSLSGEYNKSLIGFTLSNKKLYAAHARNDNNLIDKYYKRKNGVHPFEQILKEKKLYSFVITNGMKNPSSSSNDANLLVVFIIIAIIIVLNTILALTLK